MLQINFLPDCQQQHLKCILCIDWHVWRDVKVCSVLTEFGDFFIFHTTTSVSFVQHYECCQGEAICCYLHYNSESLEIREAVGCSQEENMTWPSIEDI